MSTMNRRLQISAAKQPMEMVQCQIPEAPARGAVVKLHYAGICHSDLHMLEDDLDMGGGQSVSLCSLCKNFPIVLGHEISGEIFSLGPEVNSGAEGLSVGDLVMVYPWGGCRTCQYCQQENFNCCPTTNDYQLGFSIPGGYQDYVMVPDVIYLIRTPDGVPMDVASLLPCSGITAYNAITTVLPSVQNHQSAYGKASLLIVGAGGLGLWGIQIARQLMPEGTRIILAEAFESKFADARKAGADETCLWPIDGTVEQNVAVCRQLTPVGMAGAVDFVGAPKTGTSIFGCLAQMATMVTVGMFGGDMSVSIPNLVFRQNVVRGCIAGNPEHLCQMAQLVAANKVKPPPIIHVKLEDAGRILEELKSGKSRGRNVIKYVQ